MCVCWCIQPDSTRPLYGVCIYMYYDIWMVDISSENIRDDTRDLSSEIWFYVFASCEIVIKSLITSNLSRALFYESWTVSVHWESYRNLGFSTDWYFTATHDLDNSWHLAQSASRNWNLQLWNTLFQQCRPSKTGAFLNLLNSGLDKKWLTLNVLAILVCSQ